jgi:hypothetical protein
MSSHLKHSAAPTGASGRPIPAESTGGRDVPGVIAPPPLIYLGGLAAGFGLEALLDSPSVPGALAWPVGAALMATGGRSRAPSSAPLAAPGHQSPPTARPRSSSPRVSIGSVATPDIWGWRSHTPASP